MSKVTVTQDETRRCRKCKVYKPLTEFWRDPSKYLGRSYACAECRRAAEREQYSTERSRQRRLREGVKYSSRLKTKAAVASGNLVKQPCFLCGEIKVDAHHLNYDYPLAVVWLCRLHHAGVHHEIK